MVMSSMFSKDKPGPGSGSRMETFNTLEREKAEANEKLLQYIFDHYGECKPDTKDFKSWQERLTSRINRSFY